MHTCFLTIHSISRNPVHGTEYVRMAKIQYYNIHIHHNIPSTCTIPVILLVLQGKGQ